MHIKNLKTFLLSFALTFGGLLFGTRKSNTTLMKENICIVFKILLCDRIHQIKDLIYQELLGKNLAHYSCIQAKQIHNNNEMIHEPYNEQYVRPAQITIWSILMINNNLLCGHIYSPFVESLH